MSPDRETVEATMLRLLGACGPGRTISPIDVARELAADDAHWQRLLPAVRRAAVNLALAGRLVIYRKGKPADPNEFKGVYRLSLPPSR